CYERRRAKDVPGLEMEVAFRPRGAVAGFESGLDTLARDRAEQVIRIDDAKWRNCLRQRSQPFTSWSALPEVFRRFFEGDPDVNRDDAGREHDAGLLEQRSPLGSDDAIGHPPEALEDW